MDIKVDEMIINENFVAIHENNLISCKNLFNLFWKANTNIIYITDNNDCFTGIITNKNLLKQLKKGEKEKPIINRKCVAIQKKCDNNIYEEAEKLFEKYHITTAIPVIDDERKICFELRKDELENQEENIEKFREKITKYEKSYYLHEEIVCLRKLLEKQDIIIVGTEEQMEYMFGNLIKSKSRIHFKNNLENPFEFLCENENLLIDLSEIGNKGRKDIYHYCNNGYYWRWFMSFLLSIIEAEYCSKFCQICNGGFVTLKEFLERYMIGNISISQNSIFVTAILEHMKGTFFELKREVGVYRSGFQYDIKVNDIKVDKTWVEYELGTIRCVDIIAQLYDLNIKLSDKVKILNFVFDKRVETLEAEVNRMCSNNVKEPYEYEALYTLGRENDKNYLEELKKSIQLTYTRSFENNRVVFKDKRSRLVNIENGVRKTCYQPEEYNGTIYFLGGCTVWGAAVEDKYTIPSLIQKYINCYKKKYRVINLGNNLINTSNLLSSLSIKENDIFICIFPFITDYVKSNISVVEMGDSFNNLRMSKFKKIDCFSNMVQHCGTNGNIIYSEIIFEELKKYLNDVCENEELKKNSLYHIFRQDFRDLDILYGYKTYLAELKSKMKNVFRDDIRIGCVVMNCNPFTLGHKHLVEYALNKVDYLYLFIVEEDKSYFSFEDRYKMVEKGIEDLKNILILRSGKMIASSLTFSAYFRKQEIISKQEKPSVSTDLRVFAQYIAPVAHIQFRFIGEEITDLVTSTYNDKMKEILPQFGIDVIEIPRKCFNGEVISASVVREYYKKRDFENMKELVPKTTLHYLMEIENG